MYLWAAKAIAGSLLGTATSTYIKKTPVGVWAYKKYEAIANWAADRYGIDILDSEQVSLAKKYPRLMDKINTLESRVEQLENKKGNKRST